MSAIKPAEMWRALGSMCGLDVAVLAGSEAGEGQGPIHGAQKGGRQAGDKLT